MNNELIEEVQRLENVANNLDQVLEFIEGQKINITKGKFKDQDLESVLSNIAFETEIAIWNLSLMDLEE